MSISSETLSAAAFSRTVFSTPTASSSVSPRARRWALSARLQEHHGGDAGNLHRILHGEENALRGALFRRQRRQIFAVIDDAAFGDLVTGAARQHIGQRRFARAVRPHDGMHFAGIDPQGSGL